MRSRMKETLSPTALAFAGRIINLTTPKLLLGIAVLGFVARGWTQEGTLVAWGDNRTGQGTVPDGLTDIVAISSGEWHNLVQRADGTLVAWGYNAGVPWDVGKVKAFAAGGFHNLAVKPDGTVRAWGDNANGQCNVPAGLTDVVAVSGSWQHSVALKADGTVVAWGDNRTGQINVPPDLRNVVAISAAEYHNLALRSDGTVTGWGWNGDGQLNFPASLSNNVVQIAAGGLHSLALKRDGTVAAWGWNRYGQATVPAGLSNVVMIRAGTEHSLALKADGTVVGWGANDAWANNDPNCAITWGPEQCPRVVTGQITPPAGLKNVVAIAAGNFHSLALLGESSVQVPAAPVAPTLTVGEVTSTRVTLNWSDLANETGYRLEARAGASGSWAEIATPGANVTSYQHRVTSGGTIFYRLRAFNAAGDSPFSAEVSATLGAAALVTPTLSTTGNSHSTVTLAWSDVANETGYKLEVKNSAGAWTELATVNAGVTTFNHTGLNPSTAYTYRISSFNAAGSSAPSSELTVTTQARPVSDDPLTFQVLGANQEGIRVRISGDSGQRFKVQRTTNFQNWMDATNSVLVSPSIDMTLSGEVRGGYFRTVNTR